MRGFHRFVCAVAALGAVGAGCGTGDNRVDPADLELRDVLGMAPEVAGGWDAAQRASARQLIANGLGTNTETAAGAAPIDDPALTVDDRATRSIAAFDHARATSGADAAG